MKAKQWMMMAGVAGVCVGAVACVGLRLAQTDIAQTIEKRVEQTYAWGEVVCGRGLVCAEVEVLKVATEPRVGGRVDVTLRNRTGDAVAVQIAIEILDASGAVLDQSNFEDLPLAPRGQKTWSMPGIFRPNSRVRVKLRTAN